MKNSLSKEEIENLKRSCSLIGVAKALGIEVVQSRCKCWQSANHAHGDRTPSVSLNEERGYFKCWVCANIKGDVIELVRQFTGYGFVEAIDWLKKYSGEATVLKKDLRVVGQAHKGPSKSLDAHRMAIKQSLVKQSENKPPKEIDRDRGREILTAFMNRCAVPNGPALKYLKGRKIFLPVIEKMKVRWVDNYGEINDWLRANYSLEELIAVGLCNERGHLRFFRHPLLLPYIDRKGRVSYIQGRAIEDGIQPRFLNLKGEIPHPWNLQVLNGNAGVVYLCESVIDALTLVEMGFDAVGVAGTSSFKKEWVQLFANKKVFMAFDGDEPGQAAAQKLSEVFKEQGIFVSSIVLPEGMDVNEWFSK